MWGGIEELFLLVCKSMFEIETLTHKICIIFCLNSVCYASKDYTPIEIINQNSGSTIHEPFSLIPVFDIFPFRHHIQIFFNRRIQLIVFRKLFSILFHLKNDTPPKHQFNINLRIATNWIHTLENILCNLVAVCDTICHK